MRRYTGFAVTALVVAVAVFLLFSLRGATHTNAAGTGPSIAPGTVSGTTVPINASASVDAWNGFNLHVQAAMSGGVTLTSISGDASGSILTGSTFCTSTTPTPNDKVFGCVGLAGQLVTTAGLLGNFSVSASGNGCVELALISAPGDATLDTYTIDATFGDPQANVVDTATKAKVLIGSGVLADCPSNNLPTNTPTNTWTPTNTPTPTNTATPTNTPIVGAADVVVALSGSPLVVNSGANMSYTAAIKNIGSAAAMNVTFRITLPLGGVLTSGTACPIYVSPSYYCPVGALAANNNSPGGPDETALILGANVPYSTVNVVVTATAMVSATNEPLGNQGNNATTANTNVTGCPDLDGDGHVTILDVSIVGLRFGKSLGDPGFLPLADLDEDNHITTLDLTLVAAHIGEACSGIDSDKDGLPNAAEAIFGSNPNNPDSDGDGVPDGVEAFYLGSSPTNPDSDGDNYTDGEEAALGKSPTIFCKVMRADLDKDHTVTILDLSVTASMYHKSTGDPGFNPAGDFDHDGIITILDLSYQATVYLQNIAVCA